MAPRLLLGFGHKKRNGKDAAAGFAKAFLESRGLITEIRPFAYPLKEVIGRNVLGLTHDQLYGEAKTRIDGFWGLTPRDMLQVIGTEAMRENFDEDVWVKCFQKFVQDAPYLNVIASDVRFPNEVEAIQAAGGLVFKVVRPSLDNQSDRHPSETALDDFDGWDGVLDNSGTLYDLQRNVELIVDWALKHCGVGVWSKT